MGCRVLQVIAFVVSIPFLLLMLGLATIAFRGGEHAGYPEIASPGSDTGRRPRRRTKISVVNQVFVWGLALTLVGATVAMLVASVVYDSWVWA